MGWPADAAITCYGMRVAQFVDTLKLPIVDITLEQMPRLVPRVVVDNRRIAAMAAEHFLSKGYRDFAFYSWPIVPVNKLRLDGFAAALAEAGVPRERLHIIHQPIGKALSDWKLHRAAILEQIERLPRPMAVFAGQDNLGVNLVEICSSAGIHVPEEFAVLGVDNTELLCRSARVPLSSVNSELYKLGYEAGRRLQQLLSGEIRSNAETVLIPPSKVEARQSTDVLAISHPAVLSAMRFIKDQYHKPITIDDMIAESGLSKRGLEKAFEKHLGRSPASELRRLRLDEAKRLLTQTDAKIETIAYNCGYSNSSNLSCAFRKDTGLSPKAYRRQYSKAA